ncbi:MAG: rod shape-determining protein MreC [Chloroflexi bacterium]|nr:rod shape-determining protein MreC [Chloroflexota bacterium]
MNASRRRLLLVVLVLGIILTWSVIERFGPSNPLRDALARLVTPVQLVLHRAGRPVFNFAERVARLKRLEAENESLRAENAALKNQLVLLEEARIENETLRRQLAFKSAVPNYQLLSAEVVGQDSSDFLRFIIVDRGTADGVRRGMPVLTAEGLVGRVQEVSVNSAKVLLITDPSSSVAALIQRTRATGVVQGQLGESMVMRYLAPDSPVMPGDVVLTSGLGGNFPKRLVIGKVVRVERHEVEMFQDALVEPAVNLRDLEMVMILLNFSPAELVAPKDIP